MEKSKGPRTIYEAFAQILKARDEEAEHWKKVAEGYEEAIARLAVTASGDERRLGRWEIIDKGPVLEGVEIVVRHPHVKCTACGRQAVEVQGMGQALTPFCPWCGAEMKLPKEAKE